MASVIIELKNNDGKRTTVSVDSLLFKFYSKLCGDKKAAKSEIRKAMNGGIINSKTVNSMLLHSVVKPELISEQMDIED